MDADINSRRRDTLAKIFSRPSSGNISGVKFSRCSRQSRPRPKRPTESSKSLSAPRQRSSSPLRGKDIDQQLIVDLRRMLTQAGVRHPTPDEQTRAQRRNRPGPHTPTGPRA